MGRLVLATQGGCYLKLTPDGRISFVLDVKNVSAQGFTLVIKSRVGQGCQQRCSLPVES